MRAYNVSCLWHGCRRTQYTKRCLCGASCGWASNARNMQRPLILNKLNAKCITLASLYWYTLMHGQQNIKFLAYYFTTLWICSFILQPNIDWIRVPVGQPPAWEEETFFCVHILFEEGLSDPRPSHISLMSLLPWQLQKSIQKPGLWQFCLTFLFCLTNLWIYPLNWCMCDFWLNFVWAFRSHG
jgi:hypothetical protein